MLLEIAHHLRFQYSIFVRESHMELRVEPRTQEGQMLHDFELAIGPHAQPSRHEDWLGNAMHWFSITDYHDRVEVASRSLVETSTAAVDPLGLPDPISVLEPTLADWDYLQFGGPVVRSEVLQELSRKLELSGCETVGTMVERLADSLGTYLAYRPLVTHAHSTSDDALAAGAGVCQDFTHVALALLRLNNVPCRYVNGYLHVEHPVRPSESHAWIEVWSPSAGWVGFDPTHSCSIGESYVVIAYGRTYDDVPPNRGIFRGAADESLRVEVFTTPVERRERHHASSPLIMEVPVFAEAPDHQAGHEQRADEAAAQQQQQQQQQEPPAGLFTASPPPWRRRQSSNPRPEPGVGGKA
jgi:transglutaminase-like putative cysteine protease